VNQWLRSRKFCADSNLADMGQFAARDHGLVPGQLRSRTAAVGGEATLNACGVGVAMLSGYSWAPTWSIDNMVNVGTIRSRPTLRTPSPRRGQARCRLLAAGWGGGLVVVRAHERCVHGEGDQQVSRADTGMPGGRW
jgi:hypothetical protein